MKSFKAARMVLQTLILFLIVGGYGSCSSSDSDSNADSDNDTDSDTDAGNMTPGQWVHPDSPDPGPLYPEGDIPSAGEDFEVTINPSRTSGAAPLAVFFDATESLKAADGDVDMEATYIWSFDITGVGADTKYGRAAGFVAGHVFNTPGTYTVRLDVFDTQRRHGSQTVDIIVNEFEGTAYYVASTGDDTNPGTIEAPLKTATHALVDAAGPDTQILFRNGDVFTVDSDLSPSGDGPVLVTGYSDPTQPSDAPPEIHATYVNGSWAVLSSSTDDWRFVGLKITSTGHSGQYDDTTSDGLPRYPGGVYFEGSNNLFSRMELTELGTGGFTFSGLNNAVFECELHRFSRAGFYSSGDVSNNAGNFLIGNYLHDMQSDYQEHAFRMQGGTKFFLGYNVFEADGTKSGIQIRGDSDHIILYGNVLDRSSGFHPQNGSSPPPEHSHHCIAEANIFIGRTDAAYDNGYTVRSDALRVGADDIVIRNNLFYNYATAVVIEDNTPNISMTTRVHVENNTAVSSTAGVSFMHREGGTSIVMSNNLLYSDAPDNNQYDMFLDLWGAGPFDGTSDYNQMFGVSWSPSFHLFGYYPDVSLAEWQAANSQDLQSQYADPGITVMNPVDKGFAAPAADSAGVNTGTITGAWLDLYGRMRDDNPDIGAIEILN
jgi:hypothetical protein